MILIRGIKGEAYARRIKKGIVDVKRRIEGGGACELKSA